MRIFQALWRRRFWLTAFRLSGLLDLADGLTMSANDAMPRLAAPASGKHPPGSRRVFDNKPGIYFAAGIVSVAPTGRRRGWLPGLASAIVFHLVPSP